MAELAQYRKESRDEANVSNMEPNAGTRPRLDSDADPQLPEIAISRTSTQRSSKKSVKATNTQQKWKPSPKVWTNGHYRPNWKPSETWKRKHDPQLAWHIKWNDDCFQNGRVLIIDYISSEQDPPPDGGKRHIAVATAELQSLPELKRFYSDPKRTKHAALRVIHVSNAAWATLFLLKKFNINHPNELVGMTGFSKWAKFDRPRQRNGRPFPNGRSFRGQTDPWRNVARTGFGLDYLKPCPAEPPRERNQRGVFGVKPADAKMMSLNAYEDSRHPHGYDVSVQRLSVYVQRNLGEAAEVSPDPDVKNPYSTHLPNGTAPGEQDQHREQQILEYFDNSNTVIIFETSASMLLDDCLIQPRNEFETRWRRLSFYLRKEDVLNDTRLAAQCTNFILSDVFHGLAVVWDAFLSAAADHVALLEDKIYENPADESRAPELWQNQAAWLKVDKVMWIHQDIIREMQGHMRVLAEAEDEEQGVEVDWIASTTVEYERLSHTISEDLLQPTNNLSDLMYKSVGIRDSRQSLQLGLSMWRLSWITFIFLPLTFIVGFFGMNVDTFSDPVPSIGWYFVAAAVLMVLVLILWYGVKHSLQRSRQTPYQRGLYESMFLRLEDQYPRLWTSNGAAQDIQPIGFWNRVRWRLITRWFAAEKTVNKRLYSSLAPEDSAAELGAWATFKRKMLLRWLREIKTAPSEDVEDGGADGHHSPDEEETVYESTSINQLAKFSTPIAVAEAEPTAVVPMSTFGLHPLRNNMVERRRSSSVERPSSRGSSGIMIEERNLSDSESDAGERPSGSNSGRGSRKETSTGGK